MSFFGRRGMMKVASRKPSEHGNVTNRPTYDFDDDDDESEAGLEENTRFVKCIIALYRKWGVFISEHAIAAIIICTLISIVCTVKIIFTPQVNDITAYTPYGARAYDENRAYQQYFSQNGAGLLTYVFLLAKDNGSMLRPDYLTETIDIMDFISNNFTISTGKKNATEQSFNQFCSTFCQVNEPIRQFYPNFFGLEFRENRTMRSSANGTLSIDDITNLSKVKLIMLQFRNEQLDGWTVADVKAYELRIVKYMEKEYKSKRLTVYVLNNPYVEAEMVRAGTSLMPYLVVGFAVMVACAITSVMLRAAYMHQHNIYKIILAVTACISPLMACATALGILFFFHVRFASILCVVPFLVLSTGTDAAFLQIHEWQSVTWQYRYKHDKLSSIGFRMSEVLAETGPSILISALTNILADSVGSFTASPEITLLCVGNLVSMFVAYVYQMTFFAGAMVIVGKFEIATEQRRRNKMQVAVDGKKVAIRKHSVLKREHSIFHDTSKRVISTNLRRYVNFVTNKFIATAIVLLYAAYLAFSIIGITRMNIDLTPKKLFAGDSNLSKLDDIRVENVIPYYFVAYVFVSNPGNLSDPSRLSELNRMVETFERINGSLGADGTKYFVRDFLNFENAAEQEPSDFESNGDGELTTNLSSSATTAASAKQAKFNPDDLPAFVAWPEYSYWKGFVKLSKAKNNSHVTLEKFFFLTSAHGQQLVIWTERAKKLDEWRAVVDKFTAKFDVSVWNEDNVFFDLINNMPTDTWQSVLGTLICLAAICFIFLFHMHTVVIASGCVLSVCTGILGLLSWWNIDLDPITMAAMIISIGFSVDIPAHVSYHYYQAGIEGGKDMKARDRLANCLSSVAFPALQSAIATILCVSSLIFAGIYMGEVFVKTMVLCVVLCNVHGLFFLPAILVLTERITCAFCFNNLKGRSRTYDINQQPKGTMPPINE